MTARDPRLTDAGVKATPKRHFLIGEDEWPDAPSILDVLDSRPTVDDSHNAPARPVRAVQPLTGERVIQDPHGYHQIGRALVIVWSAVIIASALIGAGWLIGSGFITEMVNR